MQFTDIFIRRPVFASALSLALLVMGYMAFTKMTVRQFPMIESSVVTVSTSYSGADSDLMAGFVTTPLENAVGSVDGVDFLSSSSTQGSSQIIINLDLGYPMEKAITDIANQVSSVRWSLPKAINDPVITKADPNANPIQYISFSSDSTSAEGITDYIIRIVQPQLQVIDGVSQATIFGERQFAMRVNLNSEKMKALDVTPRDVYQILQKQNLQAAAGRIEGEWQEFNVSANTDMATVAEFNNMVIKNKNGSLVRLRDIGHAYLGAQSIRSSAIINDYKSVVVGIIPTSDANPLSVAQAVKKVLPTIQKNLPTDIRVTINYDSTLFISASISEVFHTMLEAAMFVLLVIFLFLGSFRAIVIPLVTIPLSLIGVCILMYAMNFSINTLTLLAWVIAIGLVVDDAIVVLENIHRHMEEGIEPIPAAIVGAREIGFAIIAMTITLAAVYAPIGFTGGLTGILFTEFAFTLAGAVIISGFVALTLTPMMCSQLLNHHSLSEGLPKLINQFFEKVVKGYKCLLTGVLKLRWLIVILAVLSYGLLGFLMHITRSELAPIEDQGVLLTSSTGPSSSNIKFTEKYTSELPAIYKKQIPEMLTYGIINGASGVNTAMSFITLTPWDERDRSSIDIRGALNKALQKVTGLHIIPFLPGSLPTSGSGMPLQFVLKSIEGISTLSTAMQELMQAAQKNPGFVAMDSDLKLDKAKVQVMIDRNRAGDLGITMDEISIALSTMLGEPTNIQFSMSGRGYYVIPELDKNYDYHANPDAINNIYVHTGTGELVPLSSVVTIQESIEPQSINHFQQVPSATFSAVLAPGYSLGEALTFLKDYVDTHFPSSVQYDTQGDARQLTQSGSDMLQVMILAVIIIFLVLASQFESFRDPLIILFVVPLTLSGALLTLHIAMPIYGTLNIYSKIGLVTLVGLIAKHGILIVEFANQLQEEKGYNRLDAAIESASMRLRPILMTTGAMVLGILPLALATGAGAAARNQMGWVIVGGMLVGTLFSLFVVPTFYCLFAKIATPHDQDLEDKINAAVKKMVPHNPAEE
jgi:hydrophobe/amphiphile efflux-1 (HAE1) family protein